MALGIELFIHLTTVNTLLDVELMSVALIFWSKSVKSFLLPFGPISITILIGLPIRGANALCLVDLQDSSFQAIEVSSTTQTSYSTIIPKWHDVTKVPSMAKHVEFL